MKTLPRTVSSSETQRHRRQLARWLREWQIDRAIRRAPAEHGPSAEELPDVSGAGMGPPCPAFSPAENDVVLLPPASRAASRPVYLLVLQKRAPDTFLVAPFGRFAVPAVPGEWRTGLRAKPLRVLCAWNARVVEARLLAKGWRAGVLKAEGVRRAMELHRGLRGGEPLKTLAERDLGPPLRHPLDPRHRYLEEEAALLEEHWAAIESGMSGAPAAFPYDQSPAPLLKAAEDRDRYATGTKKRRRRNQKKNHGLHG